MIINYTEILTRTNQCFKCYANRPRAWLTRLTDICEPTNVLPRDWPSNRLTFWDTYKSTTLTIVYYITVPSGGTRDFLAIQLVQGYVTVGISLGSEPAYLNMKRGKKLNNGEWHHVKLQRDLTVRLVISLCKGCILYYRLCIEVNYDT